MLAYLKTGELFEFVTKFYLNIKRSARKADIMNVVVQHLVEQGILDDKVVVENVKF